VVFVERRKGDGHRTLDRRRTYIDVVERVLGSTFPPWNLRQPRLFKHFQIGQSVFGSTISEVQVRLLVNLDAIKPEH
jgi:hypothetical protein